jgi:F420-dependent oxidoreductase-like protein
MSKQADCSVFTPQAATSYADIKERVLTAEQHGFSGYWLVDHMWAKGIPDLDFHEGWTTVAGLAEATEKIRLGVLVTCNGYRNPGMLAKSVATADHISNGRIELGIGAGWMEEEYAAYGYDFPSIAMRLKQLEESLEIITRLFTEKRTTFEGRHYTFRDAPFAPKPVQQPMPITIGGGGVKVVMRLVAKYAHRWNCPMHTVDKIAEHRDALAKHCEKIGRDPGQIVISEQVGCVIGSDEKDYQSKRELAQMLLGSFGDIDEIAVNGTPDRVVEGFRKKMEAGVTEFTILFGDFGTAETLELFATEVMPKLSLP